MTNTLSIEIYTNSTLGGHPIAAIYMPDDFDTLATFRVLQKLSDFFIHYASSFENATNKQEWLVSHLAQAGFIDAIFLNSAIKSDVTLKVEKDFLACKSNTLALSDSDLKNVMYDTMSYGAIAITSKGHFFAHSSFISFDDKQEVLEEGIREEELEHDVEGVRMNCSERMWSRKEIDESAEFSSRYAYSPKRAFSVKGYPEYHVLLP